MNVGIMSSRIRQVPLCWLGADEVRWTAQKIESYEQAPASRATALAKKSAEFDFEVQLTLRVSVSGDV